MLGIHIDKNSKISITRQLCDQLRILIIEGKLKSGDKLPSTRKLSSEFNISRNIVIEVYEQLIAEGFLETIAGSGTYVSSDIEPQYNLKKENFIKEKILKEKEIDIIDFSSGIPDLYLFPKNLWIKCVKRAIEDVGNVLSYGDIMGDYILRENISKYLFRTRGIHSSPDEIIIFAGASQGYLLIAKVLAKIFKKLYIEEPMVRFIPNIFQNFGYKLYPIDVDKSGIKVEEIISNNDKALVLLTPSHQFPTGSILSIQRRQEILKWAESSESLIIEDDYDSEYRFKGIPIPPLRNLNKDKVIYVGTFSKNLSPAIRLGFIIIPKSLIEIFIKTKLDLNMYTPSLDQRALSIFIDNGYLDKHIYKMNKVYKKKRNLLKEELRKYFEDKILIEGDDAGLHMAVDFVSKNYVEIDWRKSLDYKVKVYPFNRYSFKNKDYKNKLVLGYGNLSFNEIQEGVKRLSIFLNNF